MQQLEFAEEHRRTVLDKAPRQIQLATLQKPSCRPNSIDCSAHASHTVGTKCELDTACKAPVLNSFGNDVT